MSTQKLCLSAILAIASLAGFSGLSAPAQAFTLTGENTLALSGRARFNLTSGVLDFRQDPGALYGTPSGTAIVTTSSSDRFAPFLGQLATVQDLTLTKTAGTVWEYIGPAWANFIQVDTIGFELSTFRLERRPGNDWLASVTGKFQDTGSPAFGEFDPLNDTSFTIIPGTGSSYAFDIEEVPTPALLPGLVGLGVAVLRRKPNRELVEENA